MVPDQKLRELVINTVADQLTLDTYEIASGTTQTAFYYTFFIAIKRAEQGLYVKISTKILERVYKEKDFLLFLSLERDVYNISGVHLPKIEFAWIYLITICNRTFNYEYFENNFYNHFNLWPEIDKMPEDYLVHLKI